jgi:hypothetical protein
MEGEEEVVLVAEVLEAVEVEAVQLAEAAEDPGAYKEPAVEGSVDAEGPAAYRKPAHPVDADVRVDDAGPSTGQPRHEQVVPSVGLVEDLHFHYLLHRLADSPVDREELRPKARQHLKARRNGSWALGYTLEVVSLLQDLLLRWAADQAGTDIRDGLNRGDSLLQDVRIRNHLDGMEACPRGDEHSEIQGKRAYSQLVHVHLPPSG